MSKPLRGVRVLDLTNVIAGPLCSHQLAMLGADVIKVEVPATGDLARKMGADPKLGERLMGASFLALNAGKKSLTLNLKLERGREVFKFAVREMEDAARDILEQHGIAADEVSCVIPHQANLRISEAMQKELGLRDDQVYNNIMYYGNTTAATIPIALDECVRSGRVKRGDLVVMTAFGSGFMWGSALIRW